MIERGLVAEVEGLRRRGFQPPLRSQMAIGYAEVHAHLAGELELGDALQLIQRASRRYARRQRSWYRGDARVKWHRRPVEVDLGDLERYLRRSRESS